MTTENSLFNNDNNAPATDPNAGDNNANATDQPSLVHVGEGKKYSAIDELDKAYGHANEHIGKIETENEELRKKLEELTQKTSAVDKVLEALGHKEAEPEPQDKPAEEQPSIEDVVARMLAEREAAANAQSNDEKVRAALTAKYGDKAAEMYAAKGKELNVNLDDLTKQSPEAVLALFGTAPATPAPAPASTTNTSNFHNNQTDASSPEERHKRGEISREEKFRLQWQRAMKQD